MIGQSQRGAGKPGTQGGKECLGIFVLVGEMLMHTVDITTW